MNCLLIGGGDYSFLSYEVVQSIKKEHPIFLFIGLASNYSDAYYDKIKKIYQNLGCKCIYLKKKNILNNPQIVLDKINQADIIYIGGGDSIKLIEEIKKYHLNDLLYDAYLRGVLLVGVSAGAILLSNEGFSDSYILRGEKDSYDFVRGLSFIDITICPHYEKNSSRSLQLKEKLKENNYTVYCLENNTALWFHDEKMEVIKEDNSVYKCFYNNAFIEEML